MSDTLTNALAQSAHSQSVLAGIQNPAVVNPLAGMGSAISAVQGMQGLAAKQGEQLVGQALQQATDENGVLDTQKAQRIAAGMGPNAAFAMQGFLKTGSELRGAQITQGGALNSMITTLSASAISDPSDANLASIRARGVANGMPPSMLAEIDRIAALPDPAQRKLEAWKHLSGAMGAEYNLAAGGFGTPALTTLGGTTSPTVTTPATPFHPGGVSFGAGVAHTQDPATYYGPQSSPIMYDANGQVTNDPTKAVRSAPRDVPRGPAMGAPPPGSVGGPGGSGSNAAPPPANAPPPIPPAPHGAVIIQNGRIVPQPAAPAAPAAPPAGTSGGPSTYHGPGMGVLPGSGASLSNGGVNVASADPSFVPGVGSAAPPSSAVAGDVAAIMAGRNLARATPVSGTQTAFNAIQNGALATGPAPAPAAPAQPPAARPPAPPAGVITGLPTGTEETTKTGMEADQKQFITDRAALPQRQTQEQNLRHAYDALKLITTGKGTENASALRNLLATVGALPAGMVTDEALYEIGRKYTERTIADAGNAGGTDTARALAAQSNPNVSLINPANLAFLRNDIGKVRQQMAAYMTAPDTTIGKGYGKHSADTASNTDYRGFNWDDYSGPEQKQIMQSVGKEGTPAHDALARAIGMGRAFWPQKGPGPIVPHSAVTPIGPPPNALAMAQPQPNPLLAA